MSKVTVTVKEGDLVWNKVDPVNVVRNDVWITKEGKHIKFCDIEDDHLFNILNYLNRLGMTKSFAWLEAEAVRRGYIVEVKKLSNLSNTVVIWSKQP